MLPTPADGVAAMDVDSPPRSRLDFKDGEEILELASPRQPRALSSLRFPPPAVTPDPEELARREARVCIIGDDDRVAARAPAVTDEARVIVPEPRAMMAPLGRAAPIIGFEPPLLGLGVASGFERLPRVGEGSLHRLLLQQLLGLRKVSEGFDT